MSVVQTIIQKAKSDKKFGTLILRDPQRALASYKLSSFDIQKIVKEVKTFESRGIWPADM